MDEVDDGLDVTGLLYADEREALFAYLDADDHECADAFFALAESRAKERGLEAAHNPAGNEAELRKYWMHGEGGRRIRWRVKGAFTRCVAEVEATEAGRELTDVKAYCAQLFHDVNGRWPGPNGAKKGKGKVTAKKGTEARVGGQRSFADVKQLVYAALTARAATDAGRSYSYVDISDLTTAEVVYQTYSGEWPRGAEVLHQCTYEIDDAGTVTLGDPSSVVRTYAPASAGDTTEAHTELGRILEARGAASDGGRRFAVEVIRAGRSRNGRDYPLPVLEAAAPLYEGAQVFDGHRSDDQMRTSATAGLVGYLTAVTSSPRGLEGELTLLPSAARVAEAFDAALALESRTEPLIGLSHDVMARFRPVQEGGVTVHEATEITAVNSVDVVAVPAAGGRATRVLAGGVHIEVNSDLLADEDEFVRRIAPKVREAIARGPNTTDDPAPAGGNAQEEDVPVTKADVLGVLKEATDDELSAVGLARAGTKTTESDKPTDPPTTPPTGTVARESFVGRLMVEHKVKAANLPEKVAEAVLARLPEHFVEAAVDAEVQALADLRATLEPIPNGVGPTAVVTKEAQEKKADGVFAMLDPTGRADGYRSLKEAWADFTGVRALAWDEDVNRRIAQESRGAGYDSHGRVGAGAVRSTESLNSTSWAQVLGDSITRQAIALYSQPEYMNWQKIVSTFGSPSDFREQKRVRIGGYGILPTVSQGQPYQPLTSPGDEEAVYSVIKRGGTEDLTWEMIVNDDIGKVREIPRRLGLAAAITIYRYVWDMIKDNATCSYDSTALFHTDHANTDTASALSTTTLAVARRKMREQAAYGDALNLLSVTNIPKLLVVPNELEVLAWQIANSAVQLPSGAPVGAASDIPNIHRGLDVEVIDYWTDADDWFAVANGGGVPLIEMGFLQGRREPELFTQADPSQGDYFNADIAVTYKIRHVYAATILDHRGFYRGQG